MASFRPPPKQLAAGLLAGLLAYALGPFLFQTLTVLGAFRRPRATPLGPGDLVVIGDTTHCEDISYHAPSDRLFAACEDSDSARFSWFPPMGNFEDPSAGQQVRGSIHVIDPEVGPVHQTHAVVSDGRPRSTS